MKTIIDTSGKILQQGDGEGLVVASENGHSVLDISEVSDDHTINFFCTIMRGNLVMKDADYTECPVDFEILADK